jgi:hypothetical protein
MCFNLEAFKAGQKAATRDGSIATFIGICENCCSDEVLIFSVDGISHANIITTTLTGNYHNYDEKSYFDLVSMVPHHKALIDSYDAEDVWQCRVVGTSEWATCTATPEWYECNYYRLHPHNEQIKAWKKGANIETSKDGIAWIHEIGYAPTWDENIHYRVKKEAKTKTVYEWMFFNTNSYSWIISDTLRTQDELTTSHLRDKQYVKTGRSWEVKV